jgi:hypothetical protein
MVITPRACARGKAVRLSVVCLSAQKSPDLDIEASEGFVSTTNPSKSSKNWLPYASNCLVRSRSVANAAFILATPIDSTHCRQVLSAHAHNLAQYPGKGRQLSTGATALISMQIDTDVDADAMRARGVCALRALVTVNYSPGLMPPQQRVAIQPHAMLTAPIIPFGGIIKHAWLLVHMHISQYHRYPYPLCI